MPGYWMSETSGVLRPVVEAYLQRQPMEPEQIATMRAYLRQWIMAPEWCGVDDLRLDVDKLTDRAAIDDWLARADAVGIDPL